MSPFSILLRVMLSLSLILNGIGTATAATRMLIDHAATATHAGAFKTGSSASCHRHHGAIADSAHASAPDTLTSKHPAPDCCKSGNCGCACLQATPALVVALSLPQTVIDREPGVLEVMPEHASPTLAHLIRPPIG